MKTRIISAAVGLALLGIVMYFFNTPVLDVAVALLSAVSVHEFVHAAGLSEHKLLETVCLIFGVAFSTIYFNIFSGITFLAELIFAGILLIMLLFGHKELEVGKIAFVFMTSSLIPRVFSMLLLYREFLRLFLRQKEALPGNQPQKDGGGCHRRRCWGSHSLPRAYICLCRSGRRADKLAQPLHFPAHWRCGKHLRRSVRFDNKAPVWNKGLRQHYARSRRSYGSL